MLPFVRSFGFAASGLLNALINERNFRVQWFLGLVVFLVANVADFADWQDTTIVILVFLVLALELLNSAIEKVCDSIGREFCTLKKHAKDFAASSVLLVSTAAALVFLVFMSHMIPDAIQEMTKSPVPWLGVAIVIVFNMPLAIHRNHSMGAHILFAVSMGINALLLAIYHQEILFSTLAGVFHIVMAIAYAKHVLELRKGAHKAPA